MRRLTLRINLRLITEKLPKLFFGFGQLPTDSSLRQIEPLTDLNRRVAFPHIQKQNQLVLPRHCAQSLPHHQARFFISLPQRQRLNQRNVPLDFLLILVERRIQRNQSSVTVSTCPPVIGDLSANDPLDPGLKRTLAAKQPTPHLSQRRQQRFVGNIAPFLLRQAGHSSQLPCPQLAAVQK